MTQDTSSEPDAGPQKQPSYIVGVGASAGGLEALEKFFAQVPVDTTMAFIVVQHLSPDFKTMMDELLARRTSLPIHLVEEDQRVCAGCIYLLPPRKQMIIASGKLLVSDKESTKSVFLPIDHLFRSLGQDQRDRSVGVILSGTGSDGSRGIEHIHRVGGLVLAQSEDSAGFDGMTRSAQNTGLVDLVLTPEEMPELLQRYADSPADWRASHDPTTSSETELSGTSAILRLLRRECGIDFTHYKADMIARRIERRRLIVDAASVNDYADLLSKCDEELTALYKDMLIGVTGFFRDPEAYEKLEKKMLPELVANLKDDEELRIWVAATATGEEAYSIAILVDEYFTSRRMPVRCRIFATDVHPGSLDVASHGLYPESRVRDITLDRLERYFQKEAAGYRVIPEIRRLVVFAAHNVITDAPFTKLHLVTCRNLFIYLNPDVQRRVLTLFHFGLTVGGGLWLGSSEVPAELSDEFDELDGQSKLYNKRRDVRLTSRVRLPQPPSQSLAKDDQPAKVPRANTQLLRTYDSLLDIYMPTAMLLTEQRRLIQTFGGASKLIHPTDGRNSDDIVDQLDPSLRIPLGTVIRKSKRDNKRVEFAGINLTTDEGPRLMHINARPIHDGRSTEILFLVEFTIEEGVHPPAITHEQVSAEQASNEHVGALERELSYARQSLNATIEELQAANEEMQSTNEELVASNEELQSTNEELHSVNEELYTVNAEYQRKIAELTEMTDDMDNLLNSTHVDTIFLDRELKVRKFTPRVAEKFNLMRQDIGRNFESFTYRLDDDNLLQELRQVLHTEQVFEREVNDRADNVYLMRILPYFSRGEVEGVVLTLVDITGLKQAQTRLAELSEIVQQSGDGIFRVDRDGIIRTWNDGARKLYGRDDSVIGSPITTLVSESVVDELNRLILEMSTSKEVQRLQTHTIEVAHQTVHVSTTISPVLDSSGNWVAASVVARNVSARVKAEMEIRESILRRDQFLAMLSHELRNPLGAIVNAARLIQESNDEHNKSMASGVVIRQSAQMARLLDDLLDVSRITLGKIELQREVFDFRDTINEAVAAVGSQFAERQLEFQLDGYDEPLYIDGDRVRLLQVVFNLLRNSIKYTPAGGKIRLAVLRSRDEAEFRIRDTGVGLSEDEIESIFEMFVQVNSSLERSQGGIGLGLTLVRAIVTMHGGSIEGFSEGIGRGSEFRVGLPLVEPPEIKQIHKSAGHKIKTIVVVEDIPDAREMLTGLLRMKGYTVSEAADGESGLALIRKKMPDVSLIDIGLPQLDGYEIAKTLRDDDATRSLFLIALTGYGQASDRKAVQDAGFNEHLVKPLNLEELEQMLVQRGGVEP
ncbi:two-component system, chemotaxis family, CheB/CheR fusion protein [Neorhodopirellula lusitana]|uniref:Two-component system, chemotaxis family, CheB/CheR fusion protein n=1 Tax=Neorhodopirellula lusitana TaxID=445327 RepID=A0ABY1QK25_9BACT|nr:chemotaxis protein CheB [Neorhodopirellula lusitana]SMP71866.1 two-component system, chemotaxis family, CheB/CheR fusion protein [Neorhodopirellula lusitana]